MTEHAAAPNAVLSSPLVVRAVLRTDVGRVRSENQDFGVLTTAEEEQSAHPGGRLFIVADGMGGHRGGATAARLAVETVKTQYIESETADVAAALRDALTRANARVFSESQANADVRGMGTTTSALAVRGSEAWFAHVGDSRIYLVRQDEIRQLTEDHSLVATMVREGLLTSKEAETHPRRNVLQRSIGVGEEVEIDVVGPFEVQERDTFILCSDGLHGLVKPDEMKNIVQRLSIEKAANELVKTALERGAPDNVTVIVARVERFDAEKTAVDEDRSMYEDTVRDVPRNPSAAGTHQSAVGESQAPEDSAHGAQQKTASAAADLPVATSDQPPAAISDQRPAISNPPSATTAQPPARRTGSIVKWALIFVLVLGAAGVWLFFNQQQMFRNQSSSSPAR